MNKLALLDTNLLVLFIVGGTNRDYISIHKNCSRFSRKDYDNLLVHLNASAGFITTSQIISETSNLLRQIRDPIKSEIYLFFRLFIMNTIELQPLSADASNDETYLWLGLNDASILSCLADDRVLITEDGNLHTEAIRRSSNVLHFSELTTLA